MKIAVASLLLLSVHLGSTCQSGWHFFKDNCYLFVNVLENWQAAADSCALNQAHLAMSKNAEINQWIVAEMDKQSIKEAWIGSRYVTNGHYWEWYPSGERVNYFNWNLGEPTMSWFQNCLCLTGHTKHTWNDGICSDPLPFICQKTDSATILWEEYQGHKYMFLEEAQTWEVAQKTCQLHNSQLVAVNSVEESKWLGAHLVKKKVNGFWTREKLQCVQCLQSHGSALVNWDDEQLTSSEVEFCVEIRNNANFTSGIHDCQTQNKFVCEISYYP